MREVFVVMAGARPEVVAVLSTKERAVAYAERYEARWIGFKTKVEVFELDEDEPEAPPHSSDPINHPSHYTAHPSGVECITVTEHMGFCVGNAVKYLWRAGLKGAAVEDLKKARWYVDREIARVERAQLTARYRGTP